MNDFPIPEDPPVMTTDENGWSASLGEGTTMSYGISSGATDRPRPFQTKP
jgi:hypothetical protein